MSDLKNVDLNTPFYHNLLKKPKLSMLGVSSGVRLEPFVVINRTVIKETPVGWVAFEYVYQDVKFNPGSDGIVDEDSLIFEGEVLLNVRKAEMHEQDSFNIRLVQVPTVEEIKLPQL